MADCPGKMQARHLLLLRHLTMTRQSHLSIRNARDSWQKPNRSSLIPTHQELPNRNILISTLQELPSSPMFVSRKAVPRPGIKLANGLLVQNLPGHLNDRRLVRPIMLATTGKVAIDTRTTTAPAVILMLTENRHMAAWTALLKSRDLEDLEMVHSISLLPAARIMTMADLANKIPTTVG